jgi:hypothetical protein
VKIVAQLDKRVSNEGAGGFGSMGKTEFMISLPRKQ